MKSMTQTLRQLKEEKQALDETIAVLEQLSRQLAKAGRRAGPESMPPSRDAGPKKQKAAKR